jgi:predicted nucleotidyltransferase
MLDELLKQHLKVFILLCKTHQVKYLYAFGSSITDHYHDESDIDIVVEIDEPDPLNRGELLLSFWMDLESLFKKKVDMLTPDSIKNPYLKEEIDNTKKLIYDGSKEEIV